MFQREIKAAILSAWQLKWHYLVFAFVRFTLAHIFTHFEAVVFSFRWYDFRWFSFVAIVFMTQFKCCLMFIVKLITFSSWCANKCIVNMLDLFVFLFSFKISLFSYIIFAFFPCHIFFCFFFFCSFKIQNAFLWRVLAATAKKIETFYRHFCDIMGIVKVFTTQSEHDTAEHVAQQGA